MPDVELDLGDRKVTVRFDKTPTNDSVEEVVRHLRGSSSAPMAVQAAPKNDEGFLGGLTKAATAGFNIPGLQGASAGLVAGDAAGDLTPSSEFYRQQMARNVARTAAELGGTPEIARKYGSGNIADSQVELQPNTRSGFGARQSEAQSPYKLIDKATKKEIQQRFSSRDLLAAIATGEMGAGEEIGKMDDFRGTLANFLLSAPDPENVAMLGGAAAAAAVSPLAGLGIGAGFAGYQGWKAGKALAEGNKGKAGAEALIGALPLIHAGVGKVGEIAGRSSANGLNMERINAALEAANAPKEPVVPQIQPSAEPAYTTKNQLEIPALLRAKGYAGEPPIGSRATVRTPKQVRPTLPDLSRQLPIAGEVPVANTPLGASLDPLAPKAVPVGAPSSYGPDIATRPSLQDWLDTFTGPEKPPAPESYTPEIGTPGEAPIKLDKAFRPAKEKSGGMSDAELYTQHEGRFAVLRDKLQAAEDSISADLKQKLSEGGLSSGVNPELFAKLVHLGSIKAAKGALNFADWSAEMINDVGEGVKPHLKAIWREAQSGAESIKAGVAPLPPTAIDPAIQNVRTALEQAKKLAPDVRAAYGAERAKRAGNLGQAFKGVSGEVSAQVPKSTLKGELPQPDFESIRPKLEQTDIDSLYRRVASYPPWENFPYQKQNTVDALNKIFSADNPRIPAPHEVKLLEEVFGPEFTKSLDQSTFGQKAWREVVGLLNLPRALMSSVDFSAVLRQAAIQTVRHPVLGAKNLGKSAVAMFSDPEFQAMQQELRVRPNAKLYDQSGLAISGLKGKKVALTDREEAFMSQVAEKIPWVRGSERAYTTYLNRMRADVFDLGAKELHRAGYTEMSNPEQFKGLADWINMSTGRGSLGKTGNQAVPFLNNVFFAPRFMASRLGVLATAGTGGYATLPKGVRMIAMKDLASYTAVVTTMLTLAKLGGAKVEADPRSTDFAKMQVGKTRLDLLGGLQSWVRFAAQAMSQQSKSPTGQMEKRPLWDSISQETRKKLSPTVSIPIDLKQGKNAVGEIVTPKTVAIKAVTPLIAQDFYEAISQEGAKGGAMAVPAIFGAGVQTYTPRSKR